jgi:hypothetical protein
VGVGADVCGGVGTAGVGTTVPGGAGGGAILPGLRSGPRSRPLSPPSSPRCRSFPQRSLRLMPCSPPCETTAPATNPQQPMTHAATRASAASQIQGRPGSRRYHAVNRAPGAAAPGWAEVWLSGCGRSTGGTACVSSAASRSPGMFGLSGLSAGGLVTMGSRVETSGRVPPCLPCLKAAEPEVKNQMKTRQSTGDL